MSSVSRLDSQSNNFMIGGGFLAGLSFSVGVGSMLFGLFFGGWDAGTIGFTAAGYSVAAISFTVTVIVAVKSGDKLEEIASRARAALPLWSKEDPNL